MRAAEVAGLDLQQVLAAAIGARDLTGARDVATVIDARLSRRTGALVPRPAGLWSAQLPAIADPERTEFAAQVAAAMDARRDRIGEYAADIALPWAVGALGRVPDDPAARLSWQQRAASIGAWRELSGYAPTPPTRSAPNPLPPLRTCGPPGTSPGRPRPGRRARRPRPARRDAAVPARHLPHRNRLSTAMDRRGTAPGPARRRRRPPGRHPRRCRSSRRPPPGPTRNSQSAAVLGGQLFGHARRLPAARDRLRRRHGRPAAVGAGNPPAAAAGSRRRRRTAPPEPPASSTRRCGRPSPRPPTRNNVTRPPWPQGRTSPS